MIKLKFEKTYQIERYGELCSVAVPFPKGKLVDKNNIVIFREGIVYPSQTKVTSYWEDKSIRWIFVYFLADLPANSDCEYYLSYEGGVKEVYPGKKCITCVKDGDGYTIDTGVLKVTFESGSYGGLKEGHAFGMKYFAGNFYGPHLTDENGREARLTFLEWKILESGSVCVKLECEGAYYLNRNEYKVRLRIAAFADSPTLEISYRLFNTSKEELKIRSIIFGYHAPEKAVRTLVAVTNHKTHFDIGENGESVYQYIDGRYLQEENEHIPEVFYGTVFTDCTSMRGGICATIYQAHQNFPKAVYADEDGFLVKLVPEESEGIIMKPGMSREQRFLLHFHDRSTELKELNYTSLIYQMPDRPVIEPYVYQEAKVMLDVFITDKRPYIEIGLIQIADSFTRCFGMMNWGDLLDITRSRDREDVFDSHYDFTHACSLQYARTGLRRFLDYSLVTGRHLIDVDICYSSDESFDLGELFTNNGTHMLNNRPTYNCQCIEGLLDYYHFTGDDEALTTAINMGEHIIKLLDLPKFHNKGDINTKEIGWGLRSLIALYQETNEKHFYTKCNLIIEHFEEWEREYGNWLSPYADIASIHIVSMISSAVSNLMTYYRIDKKPKIKDIIVKAVDDLIKNCYLEDYGVFVNSEFGGLSLFCSNTMVLEALANAYELTEKEKYLRYGIGTFEMVLKHTKTNFNREKKIVSDALIYQGSDTREFTRSFLPIVTFYKLAVENRLI